MADHGLNYRRFFAVNTLAGVRVEDPEVFDESHAEIRRWFAEGLVDGLRVDHPDGLRDPAAYLDELRRADRRRLRARREDPGARRDLPTGVGHRRHDRVRRARARRPRAHRPDGQAPSTMLEADLRGGPLDFPELVHDTKRAVADGILRSEVRRIAASCRGRRLPGTAEPDACADAVAELLACFPVYRSYLPTGGEHLDTALAARGAGGPTCWHVRRPRAGSWPTRTSRPRVASSRPPAW